MAANSLKGIFAEKASDFPEKRGTILLAYCPGADKPNIPGLNTKDRRSTPWGLSVCLLWEIYIFF
jgi:hypothetical protein